jgi:hypothetical protein
MNSKYWEDFRKNKKRKMESLGHLAIDVKN